MTDGKEPKLEILFDPADVTTHLPAQTKREVSIPVEKDGTYHTEKKDILRKYLRLVVTNSGTFVAKNCKAKARVLIPDADKSNDNQLRYPSTDSKKLMFEFGGEVNINVGDSETLYVAFADSDFKDTQIIQAPSRYASLATPNALLEWGRNGLRVEDSFHTGEFEIEITVTSEETAVKTKVKIQVTQDVLGTNIIGLS